MSNLHPMAALNSKIRHRKGVIHPRVHRYLTNEADFVQVSINLSDVNGIESYPDRILTLRAPNWKVNIGRGSHSDDDLVPSPTNAWFNSRVMSRNHAVLSADPESRMLYLSDAGSMHGTYLNGERIDREPRDLLEGDMVQFGNEVVRGSDAYQPLKISLNYEWFDSEEQADEAKDGFRNTFTVDYSEEEASSDVSDDDVEIVHESVRQSSIVPVEPNTPYKVASSSSPSTFPTTDSDRRPSSSVSAPTSSSSVADKCKKMLEEENETDKAFSDECRQYVESDDEGEQLDEELSEDIHGSEDEEVESEDLAPASQPLPISDAGKIPREPSPSDAAMARPRSTPPPRCPPFSTDIPPPPPPIVMPYSGSNRWTPGFRYDTTLSYPYSSPGVNRGPICDVQFDRPVHWSYNTNYNTNYNTSPYVDNNTSTCYTPYASWETLKPSSYRTAAPQNKAPTMNDLPASPYPFSTSNVQVPSTECKLEVPADLQASSPIIGSQSLKRKAGEISDDGGGEEISDSESETSEPCLPQSIAVDVQPIEKLGESTINGKVAGSELLFENSTVTLESVNQFGEAENVTSVIKESSITVEPVRADLPPPAKKIKTEPSNIQAECTTRTALKYAATAFAGATVGAIGTVIGLAALPPDFFT